MTQEKDIPHNSASTAQAAGKACRIIISGGGTGGHIFPAISIANAIRQLCPDADILFVGAEGRMEMQRVPDAGYRISGHAIGCSPYLSLEWQAAGTNGLHSVQTQLIGGYNLPNALAAVAIGHYFGVPAADIDRALAGYTPQNNRSQLKKTAHNTLIIDAYNANPTSMMAALSNFKAMEAAHKMLILGDMRELGKDSAVEHRKIVDFLKECGFDDVILVGSEFAGTGSPYATYPDVQALIEKLKAGQPAGKTILIKGSNGIKLSSVVEYL